MRRVLLRRLPQARAMPRASEAQYDPRRGEPPRAARPKYLYDRS